MIRGTVSGFQTRYEQIPYGQYVRSVTIWDFRLERADPAGTPLPRVAVELRGTSINGSIANGDVVEIDQEAEPGQLVQAEVVRNVTSGAAVSARGGDESRISKGVGLAVLLLVVMIIVIVWVFVATNIIRDVTSG